MGRPEMKAQWAKTKSYINFLVPFWNPKPCLGSSQRETDRENGYAASIAAAVSIHLFFLIYDNDLIEMWCNCCCHLWTVNRCIQIRFRAMAEEAIGCDEIHAACEVLGVSPTILHCSSHQTHSSRQSSPFGLQGQAGTYSSFIITTAYQ